MLATRAQREAAAVKTMSTAWPDAPLNTPADTRVATVADIYAGMAPAEVRCVGAWTVRSIADLEQRLHALSWPGDGELVIDGSAITAMDTGGAWLLHRTVTWLTGQGRAPRVHGLRPEFASLLHLIALHGLERGGVAPAAAPGFAEQIGRTVWEALLGLRHMLSFVGENAATLIRVLARPRSIRWRPILHNLQISGFDALPITGLLSFLLGIVISYQGAQQLERYGANIYVADLVGLSMLRELSPLLTAIIVAGRSGSAYAAQIGTMKVTEEIDALRTIGVDPLELLVLPKMLALIVALPLLTVFTDVTGVLGGMVMAEIRLGVSFSAFLDRLEDAITLSSYMVGIGKAPVFAVIIALVGCHQGFQVAGDAESVGRRTTVSVVHSIFLVIVVDALFSIVFNWLKI